VGNDKNTTKVSIGERTLVESRQIYLPWMVTNHGPGLKPWANLYYRFAEKKQGGRSRPVSNPLRKLYLPAEP
jgi:hypothetical protein